MIAPIVKPKKTGRNDPCPCGSGKKYKKCCYRKQVKLLTKAGFEHCFQKLVMDAGGAIDIPCEDLESLPKDETLGIKYDSENDLFHFEIVKYKKSPIIQPDKRIRL